MDMVDGTPTPRIGVSPDANRRRVGIGESLIDGGKDVALFFTLLQQLIATHQIGGAIGGPVAIAGQVAQAQEGGPEDVMALIAQLSLSVGICNLFPIPVLDGGHLVLLMLEAVRRRKLTAIQTQRVLMTGIAMIALVFVVVMVKDVRTSWMTAHSAAMSPPSPSPASARAIPVVGPVKSVTPSPLPS
jgi:regulator of sigma E protease